MAGFMDRVADFSEKSRLNSQIRDMEKQRSELFTNAGTLAYNLSAAGKLSIPECEAIFAEISALNNRIEETKNKITRIDEMRAQAAQAAYPVIPNGIQCVCGMVNAPGARFCAGCGRPVTAPPTPPTPPAYGTPGYTAPPAPPAQPAYGAPAYTAPPAAPAYAEPEYPSTEYAPAADEANIGVCPSCGYSNKPEAIFCANCGQSLIGAAPAAPENTYAQPDTGYAQTVEVDSQPAPVQGQCTVCGYMNRPDAVFCAECGAKVN